MAQSTVTLNDMLNDEWEAHIGDANQSEEIRYAIRWRLQIDPILDDLFEPHEREKRLHFVMQAVREEADAAKNNPNYDGPLGEDFY
jgi:hypothetical protein